MRGDKGLDELQVVVERRGYGTQAWAWRLTTGLMNLTTSREGFVCAEDAYTAGRAQLLTLRAGTPPQLSSVVSLVSTSVKNKVIPTLRRPPSGQQHAGSLS